MRLPIAAPTPAGILWVTATFTWLAIGMSIAIDPFGQGSPTVVAATLVPWMIFGGAFFVTSSAGDALPRRMRLFLLGVQTLLAIVLAWALPEATGAPLLVLAASQAVMALPRSGAIAWTVGQTGIVFLSLLQGQQVLPGLGTPGAMVLFVVVTAVAVELARRERRARQELARANEELRAERERIAARSGGRVPSPGATDYGLDDPLTLVSGGFDTVSPLFAMMASQAALLLRSRDAIGWLVAQIALACLPFAWHGQPFIAFTAGIMLSFQVFAFAAVYLSTRDARRMTSLLRAHEQLRGAQERLAEAARLGERLRIARELHDVLGHQLTALSLNLEIASRIADARTAPHVETARDLTRELLANVREVVSAQRDDGAVDLASALRALTEDVPRPRVHFELPDALAAGVKDPEATRTLLRCVQEIVTNAVRHAHARNLWVAFEMGAAGVTVRARDDGRGVDGMRPGNGLRGMRERLEQAGGRLELASRPGAGFELKAVLPMTRATA
jgi:signal transduction histidine kinase